MMIIKMSPNWFIASAVTVVLQIAHTSQFSTEVYTSYKLVQCAHAVGHVAQAGIHPPTTKSQNLFQAVVTQNNKNKSL